MNLHQLLEKRPAKEQVHEIVEYIGNDPLRFRQLIDCMLCGGDQVSKYASWILGHCMKTRPHLLIPHIGALLEKLKEPKLHDSIKRGTMKALAECGTIPEDQQGLALQRCFDYLLNPKEPVATQVHAMQTAFNISMEEPDLLRELKMLIEERLPLGTAGYKARGRKILSNINAILKA